MIYLLLLFIVYPIAEISVFIHVGKYIGTWNTILLIIGTGLFGAFMARLQGFFVLQRIQDSLAKGQTPTKELLDGVLVFVGGVLLIAPGFITDALGLLLLFPLTRALIRMVFIWMIQSKIKSGQIISTHSRRIKGDVYDI